MDKNLTIASFNVNSINARTPILLEWLANNNIDILLLQELKTTNENFYQHNHNIFADLGYNIMVNGQKSYNGVAIFSKFIIEEMVCNQLPMLSDTDNIDDQARYIEALINVKNKIIRISSVYVPNGGGELIENQKLEDSIKFRYKINFLQRLYNHLKQNFSCHQDEIQIIGGDFNVANYPIDVYDAKKLENTLCFHREEQEKFRQIINLNFFDSYRLINGSKQQFSWWDYRLASFSKNHGLRIDYLLTNPMATDLLIDAKMLINGIRDQKQASDHCPCIITLKI